MVRRGRLVGALALAAVVLSACTALEPFPEPADPFGGAFGRPARLAELDDPDALDDDPTLSDDELTIIFNSNRPGDEPAHLFVAEREDRDAAFGLPRLISALATPGGETTPELSPTGQRLYFAAELPGGMGGFDIWVSERGDGLSFRSPTLVPGLNGAAKDDAPAFSRDGLEVVFASDRNGVQDLFRAARGAPGEAWGAAVLLEGLEGLGFKGGPSFSADGQVLYFHASTVVTPTQLDIYRAFRPASGAAFETFERVDALSSSAVDVDPHLTVDGRAVYLSSNRDASFALYVSER